jgi:alpha-tubulin suppressor-like RCC1 family protein
MLMTNGVKAIAAGYEYSLVLKTNGSLWATGYNDPGALGDGSDLPTSQFVMVVPSGVTAIAAGAGDASLFLKSDGSFWGMGNNASGMLGDGTYNNTNAPEELMTNGVIAIGVGTEHSVIIKSDGSLWTSGNNSDYQLGTSIVYQNTNRFQEIIAGSNLPAGYGQLNGQLLNTGNVRLSYVGLAGTNYALDRTLNLAPANWVPQTTNPAGAGGTLLWTNMPDKSTNNFWRIRSVP